MNFSRAVHRVRAVVTGTDLENISFNDVESHPNRNVQWEVAEVLISDQVVHKKDCRRSNAIGDAQWSDSHIDPQRDPSSGCQNSEADWKEDEV